jgi:hypothetical protein
MSLRQIGVASPPCATVLGGGVDGGGETTSNTRVEDGVAVGDGEEGTEAGAGVGDARASGADAGTGVGAAGTVAVVGEGVRAPNPNIVGVGVEPRAAVGGARAM